jgi:hypothetical protein
LRGVEGAVACGEGGGDGVGGFGGGHLVEAEVDLGNGEIVGELWGGQGVSEG